MDQSQRVNLDTSDRGSLDRVVVGALKSCINDHGPITADWTGSAGKRVVGAVKTWNHQNAKRQMATLRAQYLNSIGIFDRQHRKESEDG